MTQTRSLKLVCGEFLSLKVLQHQSETDLDFSIFFPLKFPLCCIPEGVFRKFVQFIAVK